MTIEEFAKLENCDRPLTKKDWVDMAIDKQWATLGAMGFLKEEKQSENPTDSATVATNATSDSPESANPPKAPWRVQTYSADPSPKVRHYLRDGEGDGNIKKEKIPKEWSQKDKIPKTKTRRGGSK